MSPTNFFGEQEPDAPQPWTLAEIYADLGAEAEILRALDVNKHRMNNWIARRERTHCPEPITRLGNVNIYSIQEWKDWFELWKAKHKPGTKWTDKAKIHGEGESFFTYDQGRS